MVLYVVNGTQKANRSLAIEVIAFVANDKKSLEIRWKSDSVFHHEDEAPSVRAQAQPRFR